MLNLMMELAGKAKQYLEKKREYRKLLKLEKMGMKIGKDVFIPLSTWIDASHCYLITIGDKCRFGPNCVILSHDATMNEFLDAGKIGRVTIGESCSIGFGTIILPGVEIGPRCIIGAYSVVSTNIPANSIVVGYPAKVIAKTDDFIRYHRAKLKRSPIFPYKDYGEHILTEQKRLDLLEKLGDSPSATGYITGGYSEMLNNEEFYSGRKM